MRVFEAPDYRAFITHTLQEMPQGGRGELTKIAKTLTVNNSFLTQVLSGSKKFSPEHGFLLAEYLKLDPLETKYFIELINLERATEPRFKKYQREQLAKIKDLANAKEGISRLDEKLDEQSQSTFYSTWTYTGVQLATGIVRLSTPNAIADHLGIEPSAVKKVLNFLTSIGLCNTDGTNYQVSKKSTHLPRTSPLRGRHHMNWRLKAMDQLNSCFECDTFYTSPMRIDEPTYIKLSEMVNGLIKNSELLISNAKDDSLACLNIDLFRF